MPITFRHDAIAGLTGAYAAGQSSARRRGQKYAMDMLMQRQQHEQRLEQMQVVQGLRAGGLARGARGGAAAPLLGRWDDPLQLPDETGAIDPVQQRAAQRARARKYRLGQTIPAEWQPRFTPQAEIERQQELRDKMTLMDLQQRAIGQRATQSQEAAAQRAKTTQEAMDRRAKEADEEAAYAETLNDLQKKNLVLDPIVKDRIDTTWRELQSKLPEYDEAQQAEAVQKFKEWERWQIMSGARPPEKEERPLAQQFAEETYQAPDGTIYERAATGWQKLSDPSDAAAKQEEARRAKQEAFELDHYKGLLERMADPQDKDPGKPKSVAEARRMAKEAVDEFYRPFTVPGVPNQQPVGRPAPGSTQPSAADLDIPGMPSDADLIVQPEPPTPTGEQPRPTAPAPKLDLDKLDPQYFYDGKMHDKPRALPKGVPEGSRWVGDNGIQLPNGVIIRPKQQ